MDTKERETALTVMCRVCKGEYRLKVNEDDLRDWQAGELIQRAMPYLNAGERELLVSGICGDCFDRMFESEGDAPW